jgi:hypothetical protein
MATVSNMIGAPAPAGNRWLVRVNGRRIWGWITADSEREARLALRAERARRGLKLTLGEPSPRSEA